ncbi:MAG TPA: S8 family serine peptidase [Patescibacteria group bacterium]|nr:S8 family serine peptidase [Patescibacteria group bacterium]
MTLGRARRRAASMLLGLALIGTTLGSPVIAAESAAQRYLVVFAGNYALDGSYALGGNYALNHSSALQAVTAAGGTVATDLSKQIGVMVVESSSAQFYALMKSYALVEEIGQDWRWQGIDAGSASGAAPEPIADPLEATQWDMKQIRTDQAHAVQAGRPEVEVGILDSGIDGNHVDFKKGLQSNVNCAKGRNSVAFLPGGPGAGSPDPCVDNQFHGTHVAGTIGMRANGIGMVGVAPNVTLVPVKVCDASGYCYASAVVDGITYAGDAQLEVINMSFFVDNDEFQESTEFKCSSDPTQRAFRRAVERAIQYARNQGVVPVAALGNSDQDLAHPVDDAGQPISNECEVVPAESSGVIGTMALGRASQKASYSNYGTGATDVAAPGGTGTGNCLNAVPSTAPGGGYICISGTSMASPHAAGVAALIVSQFGSMGSDGDWKMSVTKVEAILQGTAVDIGLPGYDECFGHGRIDALRAVTKDTSTLYDGSAPPCPEYAE